MTKQNPTFNLVDFNKVLNGDNHYAFTDMWAKRNRSRNITKRLKSGDFRLSKNDELNMKRLRKLGKTARVKAQEKYLGKAGVASMRKAIADNLRTIYRDNNPIRFNFKQLHNMIRLEDDNEMHRIERIILNRDELANKVKEATDLLKKRGKVKQSKKYLDLDAINGMLRTVKELRMFGVDNETLDNFVEVLDNKLGKKSYITKVRRVPRSTYKNNHQASTNASRECAKEGMGLRGLLYDKGRTVVNWFNKLYGQFNKADVEFAFKNDPRIVGTKKDLVQARNSLIGTINSYLTARKERAFKKKLAAQRGARIAEENATKISKKKELTHEGRVIETVTVEKDLNDYHRIKENLRDRYFEEQDLLKKLTPAQVAQYTSIKDKFVGEEAYEQLLKVVAYNELEKEAEFEFRAKETDAKARIYESVAEARQRFARVDREIKAQEKEQRAQEKEQRREKAYQSYLDNYASKDGRQMTREEFDIVAENCKNRDSFTVFKDEATSATICYTMPRKLEQKINDAAMSVKQKDAYRKKALKQGIFGEAEDHFKKKEEYFTYIKKRPVDGKYMTFDQYTAFKDTVKNAEFQGKMNIANIDGQEGTFEIVYLGNMKLTDGTTLEAELDFAEAAKIRDYAAGKVAEADEDRQKKVHNLAKQYAKLNLRKRLLKKAEEHYIAKKEVEEPLPVLEDWRFVDEGVGNEVYAK
jgi:hypothetical protein